MQIRNKLRNSILKNLFDAASDHKKISEENLLEIKKDIDTLVYLDLKVEQLESENYQEHRAIVTEPTIETPKKTIDTQNINHNTLLILASTNGQEEMVAQLIDAKASLDIVNDNGDTALFCAIRHNHQSIVSYLLTAKANSDLVNAKGRTALEEAIHCSILPIIGLLLQHQVTIREHAVLYEFLMASDLRDPNVISSLEECLRQVTLRLAIVTDTFIKNPKMLSQAFEGKSSVDDAVVVINALEKPYKFKTHDQPSSDDTAVVIKALEELYQFKIHDQPFSDETKDYVPKDCVQPIINYILDTDDYRRYRFAGENLAKLKTLEKSVITHDELRKRTLDAILEAIDNECKSNRIAEKMPKDIVNIIASYHYSPLSNLSFFNAGDVDMILTNLKEGKQSFLSTSLERIIVQLCQAGRNHLNYYLQLRNQRLSFNPKNQKAAEMLCDLLADKMDANNNLDKTSESYELEIEQQVLKSSKIIFNISQCSMLKNEIKEILASYYHFSKIDFDNYFSQSTEAVHNNKMMKCSIS